MHSLHSLLLGMPQNQESEGKIMAEYIEHGEIQTAMKSVTYDITCSLHIVAEIDQILDFAVTAVQK